MSQWLEEERIHCPYCGEPLNILVEAFAETQRYFEDCQVCCQPILIEITPSFNGDQPTIRYFRADEVP